MPEYIGSGRPAHFPFSLGSKDPSKKRTKRAIRPGVKRTKIPFYIGSGRPAHSARSEENKKSYTARSEENKKYKYIYSGRLMYKFSCGIKFIIFLRIMKYIVKCHW